MLDDLYQHKLDNLHFYIQDLTNYHNVETRARKSTQNVVWLVFIN